MKKFALIRGTSLSLRPFPTSQVFHFAAGARLQMWPQQTSITPPARLNHQAVFEMQTPSCVHKRWENNLKIHTRHSHRSYLPRSICHRDDMRLIPPVLKGNHGSGGRVLCSQPGLPFPIAHWAAPVAGPLGAPRAEAAFAPFLPLLRLYRNPLILWASHRSAWHQIWAWFKNVLQLFALCWTAALGISLGANATFTPQICQAILWSISSHADTLMHQ